MNNGTTTSGTTAYYAGPAGNRTVLPPVPLPRGPGTGPAEVDLLPLFRNLSALTTFNWTNYQYLLSGFNGMMGRYGAGIGNALPGVNGGSPSGSPLTLNNNFSYNGVMGSNYWTWTLSSTNLDSYGTPPDPQAAGAMALDTAGRQIWISSGGTVANGPYDFDFTRDAPHAVDRTTVNDAFSVAEMEAHPALDRSRCHDVAHAAGQFRRPPMAELRLCSTAAARSLRWKAATCRSPAAVLPPALRSYLTYGQLSNSQSYNKYRSVHPIDLLYAQFLENGGTVAQARVGRRAANPLGGNGGAEDGHQSPLRRGRSRCRPDIADN